MSDIDFAAVVRTANGTSVRTTLASLRLEGNTGDDENAAPADDAEVVQPLGLVARPVISALTEAVYVRIGDEIVVLGLLDKSAVVHDCEEGETQLYGAKEPTARLRLRASGAVALEAKAGQDITLNGGTLKVARVTDRVNLGTFQFNPGGGGASLTWTPPEGGVPVVITGPEILNGVIDPDAGAEHVKA